MGSYLSKDDILGAKDVRTTEVKIPEWPNPATGEPGIVLVRGLTGRQRDEFEASIMERRGNRMYPNTANVRAKLVALCLVDESGHPIFHAGEVEALGEKSAAAIDRIYDVAAKASGLTEADVEDLVANFPPTDSGGPSSNSHSSSGKRRENS